MDNQFKQVLDKLGQMDHQLLHLTNCVQMIEEDMTTKDTFELFQQETSQQMKDIRSITNEPHEKVIDIYDRF